MPTGNDRRGRRRDTVRGYGYFTALAALSVLVVAGFCVISFSELLGMRDRDLNRAKQAADNLVAAIENDISRNIDLFDLSLRSVIDGFKLEELNVLSPQIRNLILFDRSATAQHLGSIRTYDRNGDVQLDSRSSSPTAMNIQDESYFVIHRVDANAGVYVSPPFIGRRGEHSIAISRRISASDGQFSGVVVGILRLSFFHNLLGRISLESGNVAAVLHADGPIVMRAPFNVDDIGRSLGGSELFKRLQHGRDGAFETVASLDGLHRLYVYSLSGRYPIIVTMGVAMDVILSEWRTEATRIALVIAALFIAAFTLTILLMRDNRSRFRQERRLSVLATMDGLTGVANRRHFDTVLEQSWAYSTQSRTPMALLILDCDHFKKYNDRYGHQAGDAVLREVARCIMTELRPGELAARYGGEEFAAILPECTAGEAYDRAERIRNGLARLRLPHKDNEGGSVTISIGASCALADTETPSGRLIESADKALYAAKHAGRNRTEVAYCAPSPVDTALHTSRSQAT